MYVLEVLCQKWVRKKKTKKKKRKRNGLEYMLINFLKLLILNLGT